MHLVTRPGAATLSTSATPWRSISAHSLAWRPLVWHLLLLTLALVTLLINGYHPLAEDGGLYVAGVQLTLNPLLFPHYTVFVSEHLHFSIFAPVLAFIVQQTHLSLAWVLLLTNLFSMWLTFYAAHRLLRLTVVHETAQLAGLFLLAAFWSLPIAGTSLLLMDPYVTGRSLSTPLSLLAVFYALDDRAKRLPLVWSALCLLLAAAFHPLMAAYAFAFVFVLLVTRRVTRLGRRYLAYAILLLSAAALAAVLHIVAPAESPALIAAEQSRYYWFLSQWHWYELLGLAGPLAVLAALLVRYRRPPDGGSDTAANHAAANHAAANEAAASLCQAGIALGVIATLIVLFFAQEGSRTHLVARMQPLRVYLLIYAVMTLLLGATLTEIALEARRRMRSTLARAALGAAPLVVILALAATMFYVQRQTFPASEHLEFPWLARQNPNPWVRAFLWCRHNTPPDALFALDTKYVNEDGEDAQTFRPIALRSAVPDFSKDGGEAAITPSLATLWKQGADAQVNLSTETDAADRA